MRRVELSRRSFFGRAGAALAFVGVRPGAALLAEPQAAAVPAPKPRPVPPDAYDSYAKLSFNENPYGPPESVMHAMTQAFKYSNRYGYPDGNIVERIAAHHGVAAENVLLGAGSGEILQVVGSTFLHQGKKVIGVEPTFGSVYEHAAGIKADAIKLPLLKDFRQDIPAMIDIARTRRSEIGFIYLCNPNNPTGVIVPAAEVRQLLDGIPPDIPVLVDEAYHHFVEDPAYATSLPYVKEGRPVIIARTFSKIAALAGMRLGYAVAPKGLIEKMAPYSLGSINALVKWGGAAALEDVASQQHVRTMTLALRKKTTAELERLGYPVIPSNANFFMVHIRTAVKPVIEAFEKKGVLVGRPFPPMLEHLRVSVGAPGEMDRFLAAFREIMRT